VYRVNDVCGNFADCSQTITVDDTIAPVLRCPSNITVECGSPLDPLNIGTATATDNCSTNVIITHSDSVVQGQYNLSFYVADPDSGTGPYSPTYLKFAPGSLPCPDSAGSTGRALDPLRNAVAYAPSGQLDALTSIGNVPMAFGQIVPYEVVIQASGGPGSERGTIEFTAAWSTYTTSNNRFGYDTNYMVYCAFVDAADPGSIDPNQNARVESYSSTVVNQGTIAEAIQGTFRVSGLDAGDRVVVEIWVVLMPNMPDHSGGTVAATLVSAQTAANPPVPITIGTQTDSLGNLSKIFALPPPQEQPPLGPLPPQPPVLPGTTVNVIDRTWAATDDCGNTSTCVQRITVRDTAPPVLVTPPDVAIECPANDTSTNVTGVAVVQEACGGSVKLYYSDVVSNGCGATKVILRTWTAIDQSGNTTNGLQTITLRDTTPPSLACMPNRTVSSSDSWTFDDPTASDTCSSVTLQILSTITNRPDAGTLVATRSWLASDSCGNTNSCQQSITVMLGQLPVITSFSASQVVPEGTDLTLSVTASSQTSVSYIWQLGGVAIPGAFGSSCTFHNIQLTNAGVYSVIVSNAAGAVGSPAAVIDVGAKLFYQSISNRLTLFWSSPFILQAAPVVTGPWADVAGATSPFTPTTTSPQRFFRLRLPLSTFTTNYSGGQFSLSGPGVIGCNFIFQASTNMTDWVNLQTNPSPVMFIDASAWQYPNRTYRAVLAQTIVNPSPLPPPSISLTSKYLPNGTFSLSSPGAAGYSFVVQASTDLIHWVNLQTNVSPIAFSDANAWQYRKRFYRALLAP